MKPDIAGRDDTVIEMLRRSSCPVILYGAAGDVGGQIAKKLAKNGLSIARIAVDGDCPPVAADLPALSGTDVCSVADVDEHFAAYHVIIGFVKGYSRVDPVARKFRNALSVDYLSEIFDMEPVTPSFIMEHRAQLESFYENLSDTRSKDSFVAYLLGKIRQDMQYIPPYFDKVQYFPSGFFTLTDRESYFDCGAFTGDTVADFLKATGGGYRRIWAAEPDAANFRQLTRYVAERQLTGVQLINKGIYGFTGRLPFQAEGSMLSMITDDAPQTVEVDTIDRIVDGQPVTYIKMDVEGAELMALRGAEQTIRAHRPVLGISIYHRQSDLTDIPAYIRSLAPEYRFYFRVHKKLAIDTVLYAVAHKTA
ncbi:MAG: FkbM family methyltransferase [Tannerella sp.]|nr:FkbM family methyltransferase [Tannerella sp.]